MSTSLWSHLVWRLGNRHLLMGSLALCPHQHLRHLIEVALVLPELHLLPLYNVLEYPEVLIDLIEVINFNLKSVRFYIFLALILTALNLLPGKIPIQQWQLVAALLVLGVLREELAVLLEQLRLALRLELLLMVALARSLEHIGAFTHCRTTTMLCWGQGPHALGTTLLGRRWLRMLHHCVVDVHIDGHGDLVIDIILPHFVINYIL
jgi:hypothetical protein